MDTRALFEWLRSLLANVAVITPSHPEPPFYPEIMAGSEHDLRPIMHAIAQSEHGSLAPMIEGIKAWIAAHREHVRNGHDLCHGLGVAIGECEPVDEWDDRPTDPIGAVVFRAKWEPDHEADRRAQVVELTEVLAELRAAIGAEAFAAALADGGQMFEASPPPLTLEPLQLPLPPPQPSADVEAASVPAAELETVDAYGTRTPNVSLEAERVADGIRTRRWITAASAVVALAAALVALAALPDDTPAAKPLPVSAADYPTCPSPTALTERAADSEPAREFTLPVALPATTPPPPPAAPRRKVSTVKLTEIDGVRVRRRGRADVVISAHEATPADNKGQYVIDVDDYPMTGIAIPVEDGWSVTVELGDEK